MSIQTLTDLETAVAAATTAAKAYYVMHDTSPISDTEYDNLLIAITTAVENTPEWAEVDGVNALLNEVSAGTATGGDVKHAVPMLSLLKKNELDDLAAYVRGIKSSQVMEPKVDGIASVVHYVNGVRTLIATRGDGAAGENITSRIDALEVNGLPKRLAENITFEVRGELFMSPDDLVFSNANRVASGAQPFANPRNATSGTVMRETVRYAARISFAAYEAIGTDSGSLALASDLYSVRLAKISNLGISRAADLIPSDVTEVLNTQGIIAAVKALGQARNEGRIMAATDGAVVKVDSDKVRTALGTSSRHPRYAMAFKYPPVVVRTTVLDIERTVGRTGNIGYVAVLAKVLVDGSYVERCTLHNSDYIAEYDIRIGDPTMLKKSNDIIPRIEKSIVAERPATAVPYVAPTTCPTCDEELDRSGVIWRCETPSCGIVGAVTYAVARDCLDVDSFSVAIANALVDAGKVVTLSDIFYLTQNDFATLPMGFNKSGSVRYLGETMATKIMVGMEKAKAQPLNRVVCALGIRKTGRTMSRRIADTFKTMENILNASESGFMRVEGVKEAKAAYIYNGVNKMRADIKRMAEAGVNMVTAAPATGAAAGSNILAGKKVVVSGSMSGSPLNGLNKNAMAELIISHGGQASSSVSSSTDILVSQEPTTAKYIKAGQLNKEILTPTDFAKMLGMVQD